MSRMQVICCNSLKGLHYWGTQPDDAPHNYLKQPHRHTFTIETRFTVGHDDRELEIFKLEQSIDGWLAAKFDFRDGVALMGETSCETLARTICESFGADSCEVREDGMGGAFYARQ